MPGSARPDVVPPDPVPAIDRALASIAAAPGAPLPHETLARVAGLSRTRFCRSFRGLVGVTPARYVRRARLAHALRLLAAGEPIAAAGYAAGFADQSHFTRACRAEVGTSPGRWRASQRECRAA